MKIEANRIPMNLQQQKKKATFATKTSNEQFNY